MPYILEIYSSYESYFEFVRLSSQNLKILARSEKRTGSKIFELILIVTELFAHGQFSQIGPPKVNLG